MGEMHSAEKDAATAGHETYGWDGSTGHRCRCGQLLAANTWRNAEPPYRAHVDTLRESAAIGWDAAVAAMRYEDGTPVEVVAMVNPYRVIPPAKPTGGAPR